MLGAMATQQERSASTRQALLDATLALLIESGYAGTTVRSVAAQAGLTAGALQHHFSSRVELVTEAVRHLMRQLAEAFVDSARATQGTPRERVEMLIDRLWAVHRGPLFDAGIELWVAARTDTELRASVEYAAAETARIVVEGAQDAFPEQMARDGFADLVLTGLAAMRGLALQGFHPLGNADDLWPATRRHLLLLFDSVVEAEA